MSNFIKPGEEHLWPKQETMDLLKFNQADIEMWQKFIELMGNRTELIHNEIRVMELLVNDIIKHRNGEAKCTGKETIPSWLQLFMAERSIYHAAAVMKQHEYMGLDYIVEDLFHMKLMLDEGN